MAQPNTATQATIRSPSQVSIELIVNGVATKLNVAPWTTLLDALREHLDLTGTKKAATTANAAPARCWSTDDGSIPA